MRKIEKELDHTEVEYYLLKVSEFFEDLPNHGEPVNIIDDKGNKYPTKIHNTVARIDGLSNWYNRYSVEEEDKVVIEINPENKNQIKFYPKTEKEMEGIDEEPDKDKIEIVPDLEKILESVIVENLEQIEDGLKLYYDDEDVPGKQYPTDIGRLDLLCLDKNNNFLVIELKKEKAPDKTIGQIARYMGWVNANLSEDNQEVRGLIISHESNDKLEYAASMFDDVDIKQYEIEMRFLDNK